MSVRSDAKRTEPGLPFDGAESALPFDDPRTVGDNPGTVGDNEPAETPLVDRPSRQRAVDPSQNVVLEASAGTGKTRVLVDRYVNLLRAGVEPDHILAITFTRKAAAEMRDRIIAELKNASRRSQADLVRWRDLKSRLGDIAISTIDAFCLSLIKEFPLEAGVDPGFDLADDTQVPRLIAESLDRAMRIARALARKDDDVALLFAQLGERRLRTGLTALLHRRLVAPRMLRRYLQSGPDHLTASSVCETSASALADALRPSIAFLDDGPLGHPQFALLADEIRAFAADPGLERLQTREGQASYRAFLDRLRAYFLTQDGRPRGKNFTGTMFKADDCASPHHWRRHRTIAADLAVPIAEIIARFRRDLNVVLSRGVWRVFAIVQRQHQETLDAHALLDFSAVLEKAVALLREMDEFAESRFRLESRHRHVLVDEFQDTSRAQWDLIAQLVKNWAEGAGAAADALPPSIFIVADRKQSIYGFRDAEVAIVEEAAEFVGDLRADAEVRHTITVSFRAAPRLLSFVNDVFAQIVSDEAEAAGRHDGFRYDERDRFPIQHPHGDEGGGSSEPIVGIIAGANITESAERVSAEIATLIASGAVVRDRATGVSRPVRPADIAILFRSRDSHREFEKALARRGVLTYVYKGLGFFDADEVQDVVSLIRYLADPLSNLRAAAFLRSRLVRLSDAAVAALAPDIAGAILQTSSAPAVDRFNQDDRAVFDALRSAVPRWLTRVDRQLPADLINGILAETDYRSELNGPARALARENLKKLGAIVRRFQNRGYATLARVSDHLEELAEGDEANASIDAHDAVSLMTVHAAKGLEFPVVFVVNLGRGTGTTRPPIRVVSGEGGEAFVAVADYQSEADEDAQMRQREETKRLMYVAMTRARDRLYLSSAVQNGTCRMSRGSLGEVLPMSVRHLFVAAAAGGDQTLIWQGPAAVHQLFVPSFSEGVTVAPPAIERGAPTI
jgi:ATP-dependent helicase/nuclease subunit A